ncbi:MAG: hypothetical protein ACQEQV_10030 [Fibrobacterota bacterium]
MMRATGTAALPRRTDRNGRSPSTSTEGISCLRGSQARKRPEEFHARTRSKSGRNNSAGK